MYRDIGSWYAMREQWTSATNFFAGLLQLDEDMNYFSTRTIWDTLAAGSALVEAGPEPASAPYEQFRQAAIRRFAGATNALAAERLLRATLLRPAHPDVLRSLDSPAQIVVKSLSGSGTNASSGGEAPWRGVALALLEYRQSRWAAAAERCQSLPRPTTTRRGTPPAT